METSLSPSIAFLRGLDTVLGGRTTRRSGDKVQFFPDGIADEDLTDRQIDEALAELREAEILRTRKDGSLPPGIVSRNLAALAALSPQVAAATNKITAMLRAIRGFWEIALTRTLLIKNALKEGTIDQADYNQFLDTLLGQDAQETHNRNVVKAAEELAGIDTPFSLGSSNSNPNPLQTNHEHKSHSDLRERTESRGLPEPLRQEGEAPRNPTQGRQGPSERLRRLIEAANSRDAGEAIGRGEEVIVRRLDETRVIKEIKPEGVLTYDRRRDNEVEGTDKLLRDTSFQAVALKAHIINLLDGIPTSAIQVDGKNYLIQDLADTITEEQLSEATLPFGLTPVPNKDYSITQGGRTYLFSDLHAKNFLRDSSGKVRVSDLIVVEIDSSAALSDSPDVSLSLGQFGTNIALSEKSRLALEEKFGEDSLREFAATQNLYEGEYLALTEGEARQLLRYATLDAAGDSISASKQEAQRRRATEPFRDDPSGRLESFSLGKDIRLAYYEANGIPASKAKETDDDLFSWAAGTPSPYQSPTAPRASGRPDPLRETAAKFVKFAKDPTGPWAKTLAADLTADLEHGQTLDFWHRELFTHNGTWRPIGTQINSAEDIFKANALFRNPFVESLRVLILDDAGAVVHAEVMTVGTVNQTIAHPRDFLRILAAANEGSPAGTRHRRLAISHNHPGGNPSPSSADRQLTKRLEQVLAVIDAELVDHVITNGTRGYSFARASEFGMEDALDVPWAGAERTSTILMDNPATTQETAATLRASNKGLNYAFLLNTRLHLIAIVAVDDDPALASRRLMHSMAATGASSAVVSLNPSIDQLHDAQAWQKVVSGNLDLGKVKLLDVAHFRATDKAWGSLQELGVMEPGPTYGADPFSLGSSNSNPNPLQTNHEHPAHHDLLGDNDTQDPPQPLRSPHQRPRGETPSSSEPSEQLRRLIQSAFERPTGETYPPGEEATVRRLDETRVAKEIKPEGVLTLDRSGYQLRDTSFQAVALKAHFINLLDGLPITAVQIDGKNYLIQDIGEEVTLEQAELAHLPYNINPTDGGETTIQHQGRTYLITDLHHENLLRDPSGRVRVSDLIVGEIDPNQAQLPDSPDVSLSLGHSAQLDTLVGDVLALRRDPAKRVHILDRIAHKFGRLKREEDQIRSAFGKDYVLRKVEDPATIRELKAEARELRDQLVHEAEEEIYSAYGPLLTDEDLTTLHAQPLHAALYRTDRRGRRARRRGSQRRRPRPWSGRKSRTGG